MRLLDFVPGWSEEGRTAGHHLVEKHADGVDIRTRIEIGFALALLRRHVLSSPSKRLSFSIRLLGSTGLLTHELRQAEVEQPGPREIRSQKDVLGFEVQVDVTG